MLQINKIVRMPIPYDLYVENISDTSLEWWFDYSDLQCYSPIFDYVKMYNRDVVEALKNKEFDFLSIYAEV